MQREIVGFAQDVAADWYAELSCGHTQHVRHSPPFISRPWAASGEGRESKIGASLDCVRCDRAELPGHFVAYKRTPEFDGQSVPKGLLRAHSTKRGVWGRLTVSQGQLLYRSHAPLENQRIVAAPAQAIIVPELEHHLEIVGPVRFQVEFLSAPRCDAPPFQAV